MKTHEAKKFMEYLIEVENIRGALCPSYQKYLNSDGLSVNHQNVEPLFVQSMDTAQRLNH